MSVWTEDRPTVTAVSTAHGNAASGKVEDLATAIADMIEQEAQGPASTGRYVVMRNNWLTAGIALFIWGIIVIMNIALLVLVGLGKE
jgi:metal iron transporter